MMMKMLPPKNTNTNAEEGMIVTVVGDGNNNNSPAAPHTSDELLLLKDEFADSLIVKDAEEDHDDDDDATSFSVSSSYNHSKMKKKYLVQNCFLLFVFASIVVVVVASDDVFFKSSLLWKLLDDPTTNNQQSTSRPPQQEQQQSHHSNSRLLKRKRSQQQQHLEEKPALAARRLTCPKRFNKTAEQMYTEIAHLRTRHNNLLCQEHSRHCHCHAPTKARPPSTVDRDKDAMEWYGPKWEATSQRNKESASRPPPNGGDKWDVVFLGDSITEHFQGSDLLHVGPNWIETKKVFDSYFNSTQGGPYDGIALGIGGDMAPQIQYRLDHELKGTNLDAKVFWILVGTNDVGYAKCNPEATAAGNIQIVETILKRWPNSKVVLNSFLPRGIPGNSLLHDGEYPMWEMDAAIINQWLECYAASPESHGRVDFFNATDYFLDYGTNDPNFATNETLRNTYPILVEEYYADGVHPSGKGCQKWLEGVVAHLQNNMGMEAQRLR